MLVESLADFLREHHVFTSKTDGADTYTPYPLQICTNHPDKMRTAESLDGYNESGILTRPEPDRQPRPNWMDAHHGGRRGGGRTPDGTGGRAAYARQHAACRDGDAATDGGGSRRAGRPSVRGVVSVALESRQRELVKDGLVRGRQNDRGRLAGLGGLQPARHADTPAVTRREPREVHRRPRRDEVVPLGTAVLQERLGHHRTDLVSTGVARQGVAVPVPQRARHRVRAAGL